MELLLFPVVVVLAVWFGAGLLVMIPPALIVWAGWCLGLAWWQSLIVFVVALGATQAVVEKMRG